MALARKTIHRLIPTIATLILLMIAGCDDRATQIAREAADRQAAQNQEMARLNREVAAGTKRLVEEDARSREQVMDAHRDISNERAQMTAGWNALEAERQRFAASRRAESMLKAFIEGGSAVAAALIALSLAWLTLFGLKKHDDSAEDLDEILLESLAGDNAMLAWPMSSPDAGTGAELLERTDCRELPPPHPPTTAAF
jgi:hypothetical protein